MVFGAAEVVVVVVVAVLLPEVAEPEVAEPEVVEAEVVDEPEVLDVLDEPEPVVVVGAPELVIGLEGVVATGVWVMPPTGSSAIRERPGGSALSPEMFTVPAGLVMETSSSAAWPLLTTLPRIRACAPDE
jgi:hypothetical protein